MANQSTSLSPADFADAVRKYAKKTVQLIAKEVAVGVFTEIATNVIQTTPILTGQARNNWQPSVGAPATGIVHGGELQQTASQNGDAVDLTGMQLTSEESAGIKRATDAFLAGDATQLFLTNNLDYIGSLDAGSSQKAPAGIVEPSIAASLAVIQDRGVK